MNRAVFFDRDGVLNRQVVKGGKPYPPATAEEFEIFPEAADLLRQLKADGFLLFVVSNQPDVARGTMPESTLESMSNLLREALPLDGILYCCHDDADNCLCRKPRPGLLQQLAAEYRINLSMSYLIGDRWRDIDAGAQAGVSSLLIDYGYHERKPDAAPDATVPSLRAAVQWIRAREAAESAG